MSQATRNALILIIAGLFAGFLSGMFGIGGGTVFPASGLGFKSSCNCPHVFVGSHLLLLVGAHCLGSGIVDDDWNAHRRAGRNVAARAYA